MDNKSFLPDFCHSENNLRMVLVLQLIAIVLALISNPTPASFFIDLAVLSVYVQWIGLSSAACLCLLKKFRLLDSVIPATLLSMLVVLLMGLVMTSLAMMVNSWLGYGLFDDQKWWEVQLRHQAVCLILFGLALRYFFLQHNRQQIIKTESAARLQALQARIRPHFLFNSLNTIASLTHDNPDQAETAIENLAELFRACLSTETSISLYSEIGLTRDYIDLEKLRLDDRLTVTWDIRADVHAITLPALTLQPLVENAIYHGIEPMPDGGEVLISITDEDNLEIEITNPLPSEGRHSKREGNQMAVQNIRERLDLAFDSRAKLQQIAENELYTVRINIPMVSREAVRAG